MNIIIGFFLSYAVIGIGVSMYYLSLCYKYITSQELRDILIEQQGEEEGKRLINLYVQPHHIAVCLFCCLFLWPWVLKGFFSED